MKSNRKNKKTNNTDNLKKSYEFKSTIDESSNIDDLSCTNRNHPLYKSAILKKPKYDITNRLSDLENQYIDKFMKGNLKTIYKDVQANCEDFRSNIFNINLRNLDQSLSKRSNISSLSAEEYKKINDRYEKLISESKTLQQLEKEYADKAKILASII